jgi:glycine betaine catabolism B
MNLKEAVTKLMPNGKQVLQTVNQRKATKGISFRQEKGEIQRIINQLHPTSLKLKVIGIYETTKEAKTFRLAASNQTLPPFQAGQYINIFVEIDGIRTSRPLSISSSPLNRNYYEVTFGKINKGFVSDYFLNEVKIGDEFETSSPAGNFYYNPVFHGNRLVFIAGGSGVTPFASMISTFLQQAIKLEMHLIYGVKHQTLAFFHEEFTQLANQNPNFKYHLVVSDPDPDYQGLTGFINETLIKQLINLPHQAMYYICGPQVMYQYCTNELLKLQVPGRKITHEMFNSNTEVSQLPGWPSAVSSTQVFKIKITDGPTIEGIANENLLITLERNKIRVNVCCRSGECSLCKVKLVSGQVFMPKGVLLRYADEKYGYIHSCKAYPISDIEIRL